jgi:ribonucleotide reductase beta subunit family protein with ferritin-like domain
MTETLRDEHEERELEENASPYAALYAHWERNQWSPLDIDLSTDRTTFLAMPKAEQEGFVWMFANRFHAEFNVARLLAPFLLAAPSWEVQLLLATQVSDEHRHLQAVLRVYEHVFGVKGIEAVRELADSHLDPVSKALLYDALEAWTLPLLERQDQDTFLQAVFAYHLIGEGVVARTGQNLAAAQYRRYQGFPGLVKGQRLVSRDEARHIGIGVSYIRERMDAEPAHTRELIGDLVQRLMALAQENLQTATEQMSDLVSTGYGVGPQGFYEEAMRLTMIRLRSIGFLED